MSISANWREEISRKWEKQKHWDWFTDAHEDMKGKLNYQVFPTM